MQNTIQSSIQSAINSEKMFVKQTHTFTRSALILLSVIVQGLCGVFLWQSNGIYAAACFGWCMYLALEFYCGCSYYVLKMPQTSSKTRLYKVGNVHFVGSSTEEAQLFAHLHGISEDEIEVVDNVVYKFD